MSSTPILQARGLSKSFVGFSAVSHVDLDVYPGSIHALVGPNGAGKTTCFNLLSQFVRPTAGQVIFDGQDISRKSPADIARLGMVRSFQISATFGHLTVLDNVRVALQRRHGLAVQFWRSRKALDALTDEAMALLDLVGLAEQAAQLAVNLPYGSKRALELATTLAAEPKLLLLDEPTQGMGHEDVQRVTQLIKRVATGRTVLMVEHNMSVIAQICDRVTVMQRGQVLAEGTYEEMAHNPDVIAAYMGDATELGVEATA